MIGKVGFDTVTLNRTTISGATSFNLGAGNDTVKIDNANLQNLTVFLGAGDDLLEIEVNTNDGLSSNVFGSAIVDLGTGNDDLNLGLDANDLVTLTKPVSFKGGVGIDSFDENTTNNFTGLVDFDIQLP